MSTITAVADAVASSLNAASDSFSQPLVAVRHYQPSFDLAELETLRVSVVPKSVEITNATRHHAFLDCTVDIGIQKKLAAPGSDSSGGDAEIDALLALVEEIADHLRAKRLEDFPGTEALWLTMAHEPVVEPDHLDQHRQFTSILSVTYRVRK